MSNGTSKNKKECRTRDAESHVLGRRGVGVYYIHMLLLRFDGRTCRDRVISVMGEVAVSPDGNVLYMGSGDNTVCARDARTGKVLLVFEGHRRACILSAAVSPDGNVLYTGSADGTACAWDAQTGGVLRGFEGQHTDRVDNVAVSPDGGVLYTGSFDMTACAWQAFPMGGVAFVDGVQLKCPDGAVYGISPGLAVAALKEKHGLSAIFRPGEEEPLPDADVLVPEKATKKKKASAKALADEFEETLDADAPANKRAKTSRDGE